MRKVKPDQPLAGEKQVWEDYWVTPEDVQRRIGLHTNVSPVTRAQFVKRMVTDDLEKAKREYLARTREPVTT